MSYFNEDKINYELIPNDTLVIGTIKSLTKKTANNKKLLELNVEVNTLKYKGKRLWRSFWYDEEKKKYDPKGLAILTRCICESNGLDFKEIHDDIETEDDIIAFAVDKKIGLLVSINFYTKLNGDEASVNRIARFVNANTIQELVKAEEPQEEKQEEVENELEIDDEMTDLPF